MKRLISRLYARQRLISFRSDMHRHNRECIRDMLWVMFAWLITSGLLVSEIIGPTHAFRPILSFTNNSGTPLSSYIL